MRILIVTQYFWPESFRVNDLALGLQERGHQITVLTGVPNYPQGRFYPGYGPFSPSEENYQGVKVVRVPLVSRGPSKGLRLILNYLSFALMACCLGPWRCRGPFDLVLAFQPSPITVALPAMVFKWLRGVPLVLWVQDLWPETLSAVGAVKPGWVLQQVGRLSRAIYRACDRILVQSPRFIRPIVARGIAPEKVHYFPNWAEASYRPVKVADDAPERRELPSGFCVLHAGNIGVSQSLTTVLEAAELTRDCADLHWVMMGDGRERASFADQVSDRGLTDIVHLLPQRPVETMPRYFAAADALLVTLKRGTVFEWTIPSKLQSYLACGRPILAAIDGQGAEVVRASDAGLVCPAEDATALAAKARELYATSTADRAAMGARGRQYFAKHFERERLLDQLESEMREAAGGVLCAA